MLNVVSARYPRNKKHRGIIMDMTQKVAAVTEFINKLSFSDDRADDISQELYLRVLSEKSHRFIDADDVMSFCIIQLSEMLNSTKNRDLHEISYDPDIIQHMWDEVDLKKKAMNDIIVIHIAR